MEDVAAAAPECHKWFQLYLFKDREQAKSMIRRAEQSGYKALVLTVDFPVMGIRRNDVRNEFKLPPHIGYYVHILYGLVSIRNIIFSCTVRQIFKMTRI